MYADPTFDASNWFFELFISIGRFFDSISPGAKLIVSVVLMFIAVGIAAASGGAPAVSALFMRTIIGVGVGICLWGVSTWLSGEELTEEGFTNAVIDSFFVTSVFIFVEAAVNGIRNLIRTRFAVKVELIGPKNIQTLSYGDLSPNEKAAYDGYSEHGWKGNFPGQAKGVSAGGKYLNKENKLPSGVYRKFDINPVTSVTGRDGARFVVSEQYVVFLTRDHYITFFRIVE